jgi:hypothetical protein
MPNIRVRHNALVYTHEQFKVLRVIVC